MVSPSLCISSWRSVSSRFPSVLPHCFAAVQHIPGEQGRAFRISVCRPCHRPLEHLTRRPLNLQTTVHNLVIFDQRGRCRPQTRSSALSITRVACPEAIDGFTEQLQPPWPRLSTTLATFGTASPKARARAIVLPFACQAAFLTRSFGQSIELVAQQRQMPQFWQKSFIRSSSRQANGNSFFVEGSQQHPGMFCLLACHIACAVQWHDIVFHVKTLFHFMEWSMKL